MSDEHAAYREAFQWFMDRPETPVDQCGGQYPHTSHLWRHVRNGARPDVDESMKRCGGMS